MLEYDDDWRETSQPIDDEPLICSHCNGSGEGMHEGTTCKLCKGDGEVCSSQL